MTSQASIRLVTIELGDKTTDLAIVIYRSGSVVLRRYFLNGEEGETYHTTVENLLEAIRQIHP